MTDDKSETKNEETATGWMRMPDITMNLSFAVALGPPVYVIKVGDRYVRIPTVGVRTVTVKSVRHATRLDSQLWAATLACSIPGAKVVRLLSKAEREARETGLKAETHKFVWKDETKAKTKAETP